MVDEKDDASDGNGATPAPAPSRFRFSCLVLLVLALGAPVAFCVRTEVLPTRTLAPEGG